MSCGYFYQEMSYAHYSQCTIKWNTLTVIEEFCSTVHEVISWDFFVAFEI